MRSVSTVLVFFSAFLLAACSQPAPHRGELYMLPPGAVEEYPLPPEGIYRIVQPGEDLPPPPAIFTPPPPEVIAPPPPEIPCRLPPPRGFRG